MGVPLCARCNAHSYKGEVTVGDKRFSLCGYCLPVVEAKLIGFIEDNVQNLRDATAEFEREAGIHNVFENSPGG